MKQLFRITAMAVLLATLAGCVSTLNVADRSFESARRNRLRGNPEAATQEYSAAATAYNQSFEANRKDGRTPFLSSRLKAGMSLYWSGQSRAALDLFTTLFDARDRTRETLVYGGLAAADLGNKDAAVKFWSELGPAHDVYTLRQGVQKALAGLDNGSMTTEQAQETVRQALLDQDKRDVLQRLTPASQLSGENTCSGRFWWRYNESPCSSDVRPVRAF